MFQAVHSMSYLSCSVYMLLFMFISMRPKCSKNKSYYQKQWCSVPRCLPSPTPAKIKKLIPGVDGLYTLMFFPFSLQRLSSSDSTSRIHSNPENRMQKITKRKSFFQENKSQSRHGQQYTMWHVGCLKGVRG